jgi:hypothetical protein
VHAYHIHVDPETAPATEVLTVNTTVLTVSTTVLTVSTTVLTVSTTVLTVKTTVLTVNTSATTSILALYGSVFIVCTTNRASVFIVYTHPLTCHAEACIGTGLRIPVR